MKNPETQELPGRNSGIRKKNRIIELGIRKRTLTKLMQQSGILPHLTHPLLLQCNIHSYLTL
jgi:hypothetical protein